MKLSLFTPSHTHEVIALFTDVFSTSESASEGELIGDLVSNLITTTPSADLMGFIATSGDRIVGCIFLSRFIVPSNQIAYILSPIAIATNKQGTGIGQQLITYGIEHLKSQGTELVFTYGDPRYYSKTGFNSISKNTIQAPFELSQPEGWLAQSLNDKPITVMKGPTKCVAALSDQRYW